ncbi:MFS transporter [Breoghania sp. L-A4]|uniref:MFS transporter n=1 Tax=Breoghania sp. L-A4 TaxID=2304600 RepID=UPI003204DD22
MSERNTIYARLPIFYGWVVIAVAFLTLAVAVNARTAFSLLFPPILDEFGWSRGVTAATLTVGFLASTAMSPVIGAMMDRFGPRVVIPLGACVVALGFVAATEISTPMGLYATLGLLMVGGSISMSFIGHSMFLPNWFVRRRGLAIGIAFSGVGLGSITLLPLLQAIIDADGWRAACMVLAGLILVTLIPLNAVFQRRRPEDLGLLPDGNGRGARELRPMTDTVVDRAWAETDWTLRMASRTGRFWWIFGGYYCALFAWYSVQVHQTKYLVEAGFSAQSAAFALGLVGFSALAGRSASARCLTASAASGRGAWRCWDSPAATPRCC